MLYLVAFPHPSAGDVREILSRFTRPFPLPIPPLQSTPTPEFEFPVSDFVRTDHGRDPIVH